MTTRSPVSPSPRPVGLAPVGERLDEIPLPRSHPSEQLVDPIGEQSRWLTINTACKLLGVDQSTLRRWSDAGKVPVFRTPGGHRRYSEQTLRTLIGESPRRGARARLGRPIGSDRPLAPYDEDPLISARDRRWYRLYTPVMLEDLRRHGRRLTELACRFVTAQVGSAERAATLGEARQIGEHYGRVGATAGLNVAEAVEAFLYFRVPVIRSVIGLTDDDALQARRAVRVHVELGQFLDDVLVSAVRSHQQCAPAYSAPA